MAELAAFDTPYECLRWGCEALNDFQRVAAEHFQSWPRRILVEVNPDTGEEFFKLVFDGGLPSELRRHANAALEHTKNSFDQATFAACRSLNPRLKPNDTTKFPWADTSHGAGRRLNGKESLIPVSLHNVLLSLKPYGTGEGCSVADHVSRAMANVANRKHSIGLRADCYIPVYRAPDYFGSVENPKGVPLRFTPRWDPVKNEIILASGPRGFSANLQGNAEVQMQVVLDEQSPLRRRTFSEAMDMFTSKAQTVIETLEAEAIRLLS